MKHIKLFEGFINENEENPKITITPQYADEKDPRDQKEKYDVNYQFKTADGQEIEVTGILKPYDTGRSEEFEFEAGWFAEDADSDYYDEHSEEIEKQILAKFSEPTNEGLDKKAIQSKIDGLEADLLNLPKSSGIAKIRIKGEIKKLKKSLNEGQDVMVADMYAEAETHIGDIKESLDFASSKLYELKKMADYIKGEFPDLSKDILGTVEPMMTELENDYPNKLAALLKKFK